MSTILQVATTYLHVKAPFGTFSDGKNGWHRSTMPAPTHSSSHGLVMNIAGIDYRDDKRNNTMRKDIESIGIAIGLLNNEPIKIGRTTNQLHNVPVSAKTDQPNKILQSTMAKNKKNGMKTNIQVVNREFLIDLDYYIAIKCNESFLERLQQGLNGELNRYGWPFIGESDLFPSVLELCEPEQSLYWLSCKTDENMMEQIPTGSSFQPYEYRKKRILNSSVYIDREKNHKSIMKQFVLIESQSIPELAWVQY